MPSRRSQKTMALATKAAELAIAAPQVVAHRVARMALAGPAHSARDRKEFQRMSDEKVAAFQESWAAMAMQAFLANQAMAASWLRMFWSPAPKAGGTGTTMARQMQDAALGVFEKGIAPVHRRAVANAKRLRGTKLR